MDRARRWRSSGSGGSRTTGRPSERRDWGILADHYAEDATYGWMYTPDEHFMAVGREEIRKLALGTEMAGLDGWHYDYVARVMDESNGMVIGFWKQRAGIEDDATGREYEILGIGGSWFGLVEERDGRGVADRLAARLVRPRLDRAHLPGARRVGQGAAGPARPDGAGRSVAAGSLPARGSALHRLASGGGR